MKRSIIVILTLLSLFPFSASAQYCGGIITLNRGDSYRAIVDPNLDVYVSGSWSKTGTAFSITAKSSRSCTIQANYVGSGRLTWSGLYGSSYQTWYWDITVKGSNPDPDPDSPDPDNPDIIEEPKEKWSDGGSYDIRWYNNNQDEFILSTNKELAGMAYLINNGYATFKGKTIKLSKDIDLSGKKWVQSKSFDGTFDGQGHIIYGIYMGNDTEDQYSFGFWQGLSGATISNLKIQGVANYKDKEQEYGKKKDIIYAGGLAGYAIGSVIQQCVVNMDIFHRTGKMHSISDHPYYQNNQVYIGGICGCSKETSEVEYGVTVYSGGYISNSTFIGNISCNDIAKGGESGWSPNAIHLAGITPFAKSIKYCDSFISKVSLQDDTFGGNMRISGIGKARVMCCCSIIDSIDIKGTAGESGLALGANHYYVCGINLKEDKDYDQDTRSVNCYASISKVTVKVKDKDSKLFFGGITSTGNSATASFSNSDVDVDCNISLTRGADGITSYTSEQMKTSSFLEELNVYPTLEMDGPVWKQKEGYYPYINDIWDDEPVSHDEKCATPTIGYANGKLTFQSETEGVEFHSSITDTDIKDYITSVIDLTATYNISVYATKEGYENSDTATATLCWIDAEPFAEGTKEAEDNVKEVKAMPVLIQANNGVLNISGAPEGADIYVYDTGGRQLGTTKAINETAKIVISQVPQIVIVKIGEKAVKVSLK